MVNENRSEGLLIRAEPMELAEELCRRIVEEARLTDGALLLAVEPAWAGAINTVLIMKGVKVSELRPVGRAPDALAPRMAFAGDVPGSFLAHL